MRKATLLEQTLPCFRFFFKDAKFYLMERFKKNAEMKNDLKKEHMKPKQKKQESEAVKVRLHGKNEICKYCINKFQFLGLRKL